MPLLAELGIGDKMSNILREYPTIESHKKWDASDKLIMTATMQGTHGRGIQFTIDDKYVVIAENQVRDMIETLVSRLACKKGYSATDWEDTLIITPREEE